MNRQQQAQVLGSLYLLYRTHSARLQEVGYTRTEAFWLNFTCLPFLPWAEQSENQLNLSEVLRLYLGIYQYNTGSDITAEAIPSFLELLLDRYWIAKNTVAVEDASQVERELGHLALPGEHDAVRTTRAASIVLETIAEWQRQEGENRLPCMLVEDVDRVSTARPDEMK